MFDIDIPSLVQAARRRAGLTQRDLADRVGTSQSAVARLESGAANPTIETLVRCAAATGHTLRLEFGPQHPADPVVERYKQDVDRTLLRENLKKSADERIQSLADWQAASDELRRAGREARERG